MSATIYPHLVTRKDGTVVIVGTGLKVVMLATMHLAHGCGAEELHRQYPSLTLGQIHSALAYYYDHEQEMNRLIDERLATERDLVGAGTESPLRAKLRASKNAMAAARCR